MTDTYNSRNALIGGRNADTQSQFIPIERKIPRLSNQAPTVSSPPSAKTSTRRRRHRVSSSRRAAAPTERRLSVTRSERHRSNSRALALKAKPNQSDSQRVAQVRFLKQPKEVNDSRFTANGSGVRNTRSFQSKTRPTLPVTSAPTRGSSPQLPNRRRRRSPKAYKVPASVRYIARLIIVGLGVATIGGTLLKALPQAPVRETVEVEPIATPEVPVSAFPIELTREVTPLEGELQELSEQYTGLALTVFYADVDTGKYVSVGGSDAIAAASTIKLPILLAFFEDVDAGRIDLTEPMFMQPQQIASGSGEMQVADPKTQYTALEVATQMIVSSDNTATNMIIDLLGGQETLNSRFADYGLETTKLNAPLPDLEGTNLTSARDLAHTMLLISQGQSLSIRSRDYILNILKRTRSKDLLAATLEEKGALTYNKTGDIRSVLGDIALVDVPNGKRYVISALVERPSNDPRAAELIRQVSTRIYQISEEDIQPATLPSAEPTLQRDTLPTSEAEENL